MCQALEHRGPDDESLHLEPGVALGARRLSIVDLAGGRQPIPNEDESVWVAFNGELFEYPELFEQLRHRGHQFRTRCDTELWVHLYEDHRAQMFDHVKGQFAVSLWDAENRSLILGRDRAGIVPLFYAERDGWLLWASEVKGLLASGMIAPQMDSRSLDHFFTCFYSGNQSRSFFQGVHCLPPGMFLRAVNGQIELQRYWERDYPEAGQERRVMNPESLLDEFEHVLRQSIRRRLRGDVPVACYLSGGIDSTIVATLACQESQAPLSLYTIGLLDIGKNEQAEAEQTSQFLKAPFTAVEMTSRMMVDVFPELIRAAEAPTIDLTSASMILLAKRVHADGYKVVLSGEGADESMAGYRWGKVSMSSPVLRFLTEAFWRIAVPRIPYRDARGRLSRVPFRGMSGVRTPHQYVYELVARDRLDLYTEKLQQELWGSHPMAEFDPLPAGFQRWAPLHQSLYVDNAGLLHGHLLSTKGDRSAMNASLELRPPFLDEDVVSFCASLAPEYKIRSQVSKWLLRQLAERWLPPEIANRPKHGFHSSTAPFFGDQRPDWVDQLLSEESLRRAGLFNPACIARLREKQARALRKNREDHASNVTLTAVLTTQLWHHSFCGGGLADLPEWQPPAFVPDPVAVA